MRSALLIVIVAIVVIVAAVATGFVNVRQIRAGQSPTITASRGGLSAKAGQPPAFDIETGSVRVGTKDTKVKVPTLEVQKAGQKAAAASNSAM